MSYFAQRKIIEELLKPPNERVGFGVAQRSLASAAEHFVDTMQRFPDEAAEFWHPPTHDLHPSLCSLTDRSWQAPIDDLVGRP